MEIKENLEFCIGCKSDLEIDYRKDDLLVIEDFLMLVCAYCYLDIREKLKKKLSFVFFEYDRKKIK